MSPGWEEAHFLVRLQAQFPISGPTCLLDHSDAWTIVCGCQTVHRKWFFLPCFAGQHGVYDRHGFAMEPTLGGAAAQVAEWLTDCGGQRPPGDNGQHRCPITGQESVQHNLHSLQRELWRVEQCSLSLLLLPVFKHFVWNAIWCSLLSTFLPIQWPDNSKMKGFQRSLLSPWLVHWFLHVAKWMPLKLKYNIYRIYDIYCWCQTTSLTRLESVSCYSCCFLAPLVSVALRFQQTDLHLDSLQSLNLANMITEYCLSMILSCATS